MTTLEASRPSPTAVLIAELSRHCKDIKRKNISLTKRIEEISKSPMEELSKTALSTELKIYRYRLVQYADILFDSQKERPNETHSDEVTAKLFIKQRALRDQIFILTSCIHKFKGIQDKLPHDPNPETEKIELSSNSQSNDLTRIPTELSLAENAFRGSSDSNPTIIGEEDEEEAYAGCLEKINDQIVDVKSKHHEAKMTNPQELNAKPLKDEAQSIEQMADTQTNLSNAPANAADHGRNVSRMLSGISSRLSKYF